MKLTEIYSQTKKEQEKPQVNIEEVKQQFNEMIKSFKNHGKTIYSIGKYRKIAEYFNKLAENAEHYLMSESDSWFDNITIKRNINELKKYTGEFAKTSAEAQALQERLAALYEDIGTIVNRYFDIPDDNLQVSEGNWFDTDDKYDSDDEREYKQVYRNRVHNYNRKNKQRYPCPTCGEKDALSSWQKSQGYQCDKCADRAEGKIFEGEGIKAPKGLTASQHNAVKNFVTSVLKQHPNINPGKLLDVVHNRFSDVEDKHELAYSAIQRVTMDLLSKKRHSSGGEEFMEEGGKSKKDNIEVYHKTYSSAISAALDMAKSRGYDYDTDEFFDKVSVGPKKPSPGVTNRFSLSLTKNGKPVNHNLIISVYGMDSGSYELNAYIS